MNLKINYYLIFLFIPFIFSGAAVAKCTGTNSYSTCYDDYGNQYNVQRYGNRTIVNGYNKNTGSNWSQNSNTIGNTTYQNGIDSQGNSWNQTIRQNGNRTTYSGVDSKGNSYYKTCSTNYNGKKICY